MKQNSLSTGTLVFLPILDQFDLEVLEMLSHPPYEDRGDSNLLSIKFWRYPNAMLVNIETT